MQCYGLKATSLLKTNIRAKKTNCLFLSDFFSDDAAGKSFRNKEWIEKNIKQKKKTAKEERKMRSVEKEKRLFIPIH